MFAESLELWSTGKNGEKGNVTDSVNFSKPAKTVACPGLPPVSSVFLEEDGNEKGN